MTAQENRPLTQQLTTSRDSQHSSGLKQWLQKKFSISTADDKEQVKESSCGTTSSSNIEFQVEIPILPPEEHSFQNGVTPVTKDECSSSALADDDCVSNHSSGRVNVNNLLDVPTRQSKLPTSQKNTYEREEDQRIACRLPSWLQKKCTRFAKFVKKPVQESICDASSSSSLKCQGEIQILPAEEHSRKNRVTPVAEDECGISVSADDDHWSNHSSGRINVDNILDAPTHESELPTSQEEGQRIARCSPSGNLTIRSSLDDDTGEMYLNNSDCNASEYSEVKQLARHQDDLHQLSCEVVDLEEYNVHVKGGKNVNIGTDECLTIAVFQKQTVHNAMNDCTITDSIPVSDIECSDLDFLRKEKFSDSLVVTEEGPIGNQTERFSHSTLPSSCDVDVVAAQTKKTRKCKKKYRKKCKKSKLPHGETSSLASSSWNENLFDESSIPFGYHYSNYQTHRPRRRKRSHENTKPPFRDHSDIKQFHSNLSDSGFDKSLDPVSFSWLTDDVDSDVIECHKRKKKIRSFGPLRHVKNSYSFKKQCKEFFRNQLKKKVKSIVREIHVDHRYLMEFGLGSYFDRLNNGSPPPGRPENNKPPCRDNSDMKQFSSCQVDSGIGASLDTDMLTWQMKDVDSEVIYQSKKKKKIKYIDSLRHVKKNYSFKKQCNNFFRNQQMKKLKSIARELHVDNGYLQFMHFGLGSYFDRLNNGSPPSLQEQMRYEWLRLASFQHYTGAGNALNLARNGFYHRHTDGPSSTRCAYCDATHSGWEYFNNIEASHRQISPNCPFHGDRSEESLNFAIHNHGPEVSNNLENDDPFYPSVSVCEVSEVNGNTVRPSTNPESVIGQVDSLEHPECILRRAATYQHHTTAVTSSSRLDQNNENSACSTYTLSRSLTLTSPVDEVARGLENTSVSQANPSNTNGESVSQQPTEDPEGRERRTGERVSGLTRTSSNDPVGNHAPQNPAPVNRDSTPPTLENVKHPEFRTIAQRVNSFQGFPDYLDQTPEQMALAGLYFVGGADFTRCFCCGGGLRNWEAGDDPLLEHMRWFPQCEYVLRLKGERYVAVVQRRHKEHMEQQRQQQIEIANQRDADRNPPDPMTTYDARVMREMGYADLRIRETILAVRRQIGTHMITTQQVLSWLLDQDDDSTTTTAASSMYQTGNETNSIYTGINMASEQDDSSYTTAAQSSINTTVNTTTLKTRESGQGSGATSGSNSATAASSGNGNQQTDTTSTASGADTSLGPSSQTGAKRNGKKKKAKGNTKTGQPAGATGGPGIDTARKLRAENEKLRDMQTCKICMERPVNTTMLPCGHLVSCDICASRLRDCPVCRKRIKGTVKTFMS